MDDREWAARWVGWVIHGRTYRGGKSDADLAEAVRVKFIGTEPTRESVEAVEHLKREWLFEGPLAFISAVREAVDGIQEG